MLGMEPQELIFPGDGLAPHLRTVRGGNAGTLVSVPVEFGRPTGIRTQNQRIIGSLEVAAAGATSRPALRLVSYLVYGFFYSFARFG